MVLKNFTSLLVSLIIINILSGQVWQQTNGTPEGTGVNDMLYQKSTGNLFVATGSITGGDDGGIRRSADEGETWENLLDCYVARVIIEGSDGHLYASWWPYPEPEGLYRSTNNGDSWELLTNAPGSGYINAVDVDGYTDDKETILYCATSLGVYRSLDNGLNWELANNGLPANPTVLSVAVDSNGYVAIAASSGVYYSENNGNTWDLIPGLPDGQPPVLVQFGYSSGEKKESNLVAGVGGNQVLSQAGGFYIRQYSSLNFNPFIGLGLNDTPEDNMFWYFNEDNITAMISVINSMPPQPGSLPLYQYVFGTGDLTTLSTEGIPAGYQIRRIDGYYDNKGSNVVLFTGIFGGFNGGAKIYKTSYALLGYEDNADLSNPLSVHIMPNPANERTTFHLTTAELNPVKISISDIAGQDVWSFSPINPITGSTKLDWDCSKVEPGIYFYSITNGNEKLNGKLIVK